MAQLENQQQQHVVHKTKSLICALNLVSRNLPLPPDLYDTVSSIYFDPEDAAVNASVDAAGGGVSEAKAVTRQGLEAHGSYTGDLLADFEESLLEQRPNCMSGSELRVSTENRYQSHIQRRLTELEALPSNRGEDLQTKCLLELYGLKLAELQSKVRSNMSSEYWLRMHCAEPDKQLFDWGMMRLRRPLYGVGDAFAMDADDQFRKKRDAERLSRLEEEEKNLMETRKRKFFAELLNAVREFQLQIQASMKRRKQRNDGVQAWHGRQRQRATRLEKLRFQALKADDQEAYMRMVKESKNERLTMLLEETNKLLVNLGAAVQRQKDAKQSEGIEDFKDSEADSPETLSSLGKTSGWGRCIKRFTTASVAEELITPPVQISYTQNLINGQFVDAASGKTFPTYDPRTGEVIAHVAEGDAEDINRAVAAARKAFDEGPWPRMTAYERSLILLRFADLVEKHTEELAALETWNNGKPYEQSAKSELPLLARLFRYYAGWADKIHGLTVPADGNYHVQTLHEPIGVAGQIIPWNFPLIMFAWKVGPALACGNTIVLKTAEQTPLTALFAGKLFHEAGLPAGVLNVVSGFGPTAGAALASHMDVDKLAFTGSTDTGKIVLELAARSNLKPVTLELGGKSPFIVCEDADVDQAVELAHFALFFNQGQCCCAGSRTFVHEQIYDEFIEKAKARAMRRIVGDPFKKGVEQGPQIDTEQFEKVLRYIKSGVQSNATLLCGGDRLGSKGHFIQPTVFANVQDDMLIAKDEIFGPVQSILKFKDTEEAVQRANTTRYGLAAGVFTKSLDTANMITRALRVGTVWVNCFDVFDAAIPFGGYKMSGIGREKGIYSLKNYLQVKAIVTPLKKPAWL